jgi:hypothetical protein
MLAALNKRQREMLRIDVEEISGDVLKLLELKMPELKERGDSKLEAPSNHVALTSEYFKHHDKFEQCQLVRPEYFTPIAPGKTYFYSHRWETPEHPDPNGAQFQAIKAFIEKNHVHSLWFDFSCMPQRPRSAGEEGLFQDRLKNLDELLSVCHTVVYFSEEYMSRSWCFAEFNMSTLLKFVGANVNPEKVDKEKDFAGIDFFAWPILIHQFNPEAGDKFIKFFCNMCIDDTTVTNKSDKAFIKGAMHKYFTTWRPSYLERFEVLKRMMEQKRGDNMLNLANISPGLSEPFLEMHQATLALLK